MTYSLNLVTQQRNVQNDINAPTDINFAPLVIAAKGEPGVDLKLKVSLKSNRSHAEKSGHL